MIPKNNASVLYFEEQDMEDFGAKLESYKDAIQYVTELTALRGGRKWCVFMTWMEIS